MKISELIGEELAYWVAKAQGWEYRPNMLCWKMDCGKYIHIDKYRPDINWCQCGELIEKFDVEVSPFYSEQWTANKRLNLHGFMLVQQQGTTPQEAICRAVVASVYGEEVEEKA